MPKLPEHAIWITVAILWEEPIVELERSRKHLEKLHTNKVKNIADRWMVHDTTLKQQPVSSVRKRVLMIL